MTDATHFEAVAAVCTPRRPVLTTAETFDHDRHLRDMELVENAIQHSLPDYAERLRAARVFFGGTSA